MLYPLTFHPIFKERIWGARNLQRLYGKPLPAGVPIGESWEISDHQDDVSIIANGPLAGKDIRWLIERHRDELLGSAKLANGRFPLLIKILDAQDKLSLQVHPPAETAAQLGGEPKTEMWYVAEARPGAELFVGLKRGVTRADFEQKIRDGTVADCFHRIQIRAEDAMFLPAGRVHAIGAGIVLFEVQQNSDTTYRVFDWNRVGAGGRPRELHVAQSLASIDFCDFEPQLIPRRTRVQHECEVRPLVDDPLFSVDVCTMNSGQNFSWMGERMKIIGVVNGRLVVQAGDGGVTLRAGQFCLIPACAANANLHAETLCNFLRIWIS